MTSQSKAHQNTKLVYYTDLKSLGIPFSRSHIYVLMRANKFPKTVKISNRRVAWVRAEIDSWFQAIMDAHRPQRYVESSGVTIC